MNRLNLLLSLVLILLLTSCERENEDSLDPLTGQRSIEVETIDDIEPWFNQFIVDNVGQTNANDAFELFDIRWDESMQWNDSTYVYPMYHFIPSGKKGYTRLLVQLQESGPIALFYQVLPNDQNKLDYSQNDILHFNGTLIGFDIFDGYKDMIEYVDGELKYYHAGNSLIYSRCISCWPSWWSIPQADGTGGGGWPWDTGDGSSNGFGSFDSAAGRILGCFEACPNGYPKNGKPCLHQRDCSGVDTGGGSGFDINIINIPGRPGWMIHGNGSNTTAGGGGGNGSAGGGTNGNPKNPIDEAGMDEIRRQQYITYTCEYLESIGKSENCELIGTLASTNCGDLYIDSEQDIKDCIQTILVDVDAAVENCVNDYGFTRTDKQHLIDLDCEALACISANQELKDKVLEASKSGFMDPCQPNKSTKDLIDDMLAAAKGGKDCPTVEAFEDALDDAFSDCAIGMDDEILNPCELALLTTEYGFCSVYLLENRTKAFDVAGHFFDGVGGENGCGDAFRHAYFNALNAKDCGSLAAFKWGEAHECNDNSAASAMDLYNNTVGHSYGDSNLSDDDIANEICSKLSGGELLVFEDSDNDFSSLINSSSCSCN